MSDICYHIQRCIDGPSVLSTLIAAKAEIERLRARVKELETAAVAEVILKPSRQELARENERLTEEVRRLRRAMQSRQKAEPAAGDRYANCDVADKALQNLKKLRDAARNEHTGEAAMSD